MIGADLVGEGEGVVVLEGVAASVKMLALLEAMFRYSQSCFALQVSLG